MSVLSEDDVHTSDDVFTDGSGPPYAVVLSAGRGQSEINLARNEPPSVSNSNSSSAQFREKRRHELRVTNKKLRRRNKRLAVQLVSMVMLVIVTVIPLFVQIPLLGTRLLFWATSASTVPETSERSGGAYPCVDMTQGFSEELLDRCQVPDDDDDGCTADVNKVVCIMTKTMEDLDRRTQKLDRETNDDNKWIDSLLDMSAHNNISDVYNQRPSFHLHLYHSYDSDPAQTNKGFGRLRWNIRGGLSSVRNMKINAQGPSTLHVTVTHPGYYYVYSHVTYNDLSSGRESKRHMIYKNYRCGPRGCSGNSRKLLESVRVFNETQHVSFLQGVFLLRANDTLSVLAHLGHINSWYLRQRKRTFFGAFRI